MRTIGCLISLKHSKPKASGRKDTDHTIIVKSSLFAYRELDQFSDVPKLPLEYRKVHNKIELLQAFLCEEWI